MSMSINRTAVLGAALGVLLGAFIAFAVTKNAMAGKQIDSWTAGVYFGCRNAPSGPVTTDTKRCLDL
jgi:hypothetical protein